MSYDHSVVGLYGKVALNSRMLAKLIKQNPVARIVERSILDKLLRRTT